MIQDHVDGVAPSASAGATAPYTVTAEFYDILQAESDRRLAEHRFAAAASAARVGIVDVGAGTGIVTEVLLARSAAPVHAVEPATPMRVALLTRLAALSADVRARVTVHPGTLQGAGLTRQADLVVCANVAGVVEPPLRRLLWRAAAEALVPGGQLLVDPPPTSVPDEPTRRDLPPVRVGPDTYSAQVCLRPDRGLLAVAYTYRVERGGRTVRLEHEEFTMWPASTDTVHEELREAGFSVTGPANGLVRATRDPDLC
ncbi:Methyltransferase type 12 [Catenulispora acidiphila DSM 44928]|uniref:Methyltransferase type 12 n=1 Tax=Catenulispora acidiphila (strain DSM 44928 / JCM 14897 / NBRC 102108 / NRRL B-24433 / ID139908) TaxID=479433 RepID=C7Q8X4_CATAD|nr:class I SAM-dependent methyltransferase [Catenulispora acidiphila]ACU72294.1 Methyltransferase type 12 [Catenulispora acidiphila DSM 44928]